MFIKNKLYSNKKSKHNSFVVLINKKFLSTNKSFLNIRLNKPLNLTDIGSTNAGIFSKDISEIKFHFNEGSNFQNLLLLNKGISNNRLAFSTNFSFLQLHELFLKKDLSSSNHNPLFFLFWEGIPRREVTGLSVFIGNLLYTFGGISCVLGSRSSILWKSLFIGGGRFKKLSYISGRSGVITSQRSNFFEGSRTFFSSNSENKGSFILNDFLSRLRVGGFSYDIHYSLAGLAFIANTEFLKDLKTRLYLSSCFARNIDIKVNNLLIGSVDTQYSKFLNKRLKIKNISFLDSYKISGKILKSFKSDSINVFSIPSEHESSGLVQNLQGNLILAPKAITMKSQLIRSFSLISNVLIESFFSKLTKSLWTTLNNQNDSSNYNIKGSFLEIKNRVYSLLESNNYTFTLNNYKTQKPSTIYLFSETSAPFVHLNICSVDGPSNHSRTMSELNWALKLNTNF